MQGSSVAPRRRTRRFDVVREPPAGPMTQEDEFGNYDC